MVILLSSICLSGVAVHVAWEEGWNILGFMLAEVTFHIDSLTLFSLGFSVALRGGKVFSTYPLFSHIKGLNLSRFKASKFVQNLQILSANMKT